jgi:hypothetical protein
MIKRFLFPLLMLALLAACSGAPALPTATPTGVVSIPPATVTDQPPVDTARPSASVTPAPSATATMAPDAWMDQPVVPAGVSQRVKDIYALGQSLGNNPSAFSKIGDCDTSASWFLEDFDLSPAPYVLGDYSNLKTVIDTFHGSYSRVSVAARKGFVAASVLSPIWSDPTKCQASETPLACEVRLNRPSFAFILLGTNDYNHRQEFEPNMRKILDSLIAQGIVPILATKADDMEGDYSINATIARLAYEYQLPLWNFWRAVQPLPNHGLQADKSHLTFAQNIFNDPVRMLAAWPWRNLTALQTLDIVWRGASGHP